MLTKVGDDQVFFVNVGLCLKSSICFSSKINGFWTGCGMRKTTFIKGRWDADLN